MGNELECKLSTESNETFFELEKKLINEIQTNKNKEINLRLSKSEYSSLLKVFFTNQKLLYPKNDTNLSKFKSNIKKLRKKILEIKKDSYPKKYYSLSCILGAFLGDSLGSYCEFNNKDSENYKSIFKGDNKFKKPPGQITDDSEMAFSFAFAIMDTSDIKKIDSNIIYYYYGCWIKSKPFDCGKTIYNALKFFDFNKSIGDDILSNIKFPEINNNSLSNGFLMRINTFVVWFYYCNYNYLNNIISKDDNEQYLELFNLIKENGLKDNICTHLNKQANSATGFFVFLALIAMLGYSSDIILNKFNILLKNKFTDSNDNNVFNEINLALSEFKKSDFNKELFFFQYKKNDGYYFYSFKLTLYYLTFFDDYKAEQNYSKFRVIMNEICNFGGDTDTNCAIVATVIGPIIGFDNFGDDLKTLLKCIPNDRIQYTNALIYYYVDFLEKNINNSDIDSDIIDDIIPICDNNYDNKKDDINDKKEKQNEQNNKYFTLYILLNVIYNDINN